MEGTKPMTVETQSVVDRIKNDPEFHELVRQRTTFAWLLSLVMIVIYFGFVLLVAFDKQLLGRSLSGGVTTVGIPIGLGVILSAFVLTGIYVRRANSLFDDLTKKLKEKVNT